MPLPFVLLFVIPAGAAVLLFKLLPALPEGFTAGWGFIALLIAPGLVTGLLSRLVCTRYRVEPATGWSIVIAASLIAVILALGAFFTFAIAYSE